MSAGLQSTFFDKGSSGESVEIETDGRTIRPISHLLNAIVDETKMTVSERGLEMIHVDPANVAMVDLHVYPAAFDTFEVSGEETIGLATDQFRSAVSNERMSTRTNDRVDLSLDADTTLITVEKKYGDTTVRKTDELLNIDPDSVRKRPDPPGLDVPIRATIDVNALHDILNTWPSDYVTIKSENGHLLIHSHDAEDRGISRSFVDFGPIAGEADVSSTFTLGYLLELVAALKKAKVQTVDLKLGDTIPVVFDFERTVDDDGDAETLYEGSLMVAPRIQDGGD